ncbi:MAG TPA: hypothetical protein VKC90_04545, partial [Chitinophagaceae bacterium]|nr:hypothetical protein [Chitinophagaceae bacterium]
LTDSLRADRLQEVDRIAAANLMPSYLTREQFIADSTRAFEWFKITKDSSYIDKYTLDEKCLPAGRAGNEFSMPVKKPALPANTKIKKTEIAIIDDRNLRKKNFFVLTS